MMTTPSVRNFRDVNSAATVLVVEDDPILRFALSTELNQAGFRVREAGNSEEAETVLSTGSAIDLVITDIEMPGPRDGLALARSVRAFHPNIRVIVVSGISPDVGLVGVADAFFGKPYDTDRVILRIRSLLAQRRRSIARR